MEPGKGLSKVIDNHAEFFGIRHLSPVENEMSECQMFPIEYPKLCCVKEKSLFYEWSVFQGMHMKIKIIHYLFASICKCIMRILAFFQNVS